MPENKHKCPKCGSSDYTLEEYVWNSPCHYDGTSEYKCNVCGTRVGRWTGKVLADDEFEPPYGDKVYIKQPRDKENVKHV